MQRSSKSEEDFTGQSRLAINVVTSWLSQILVIIAGFFLPRAIDNNLGQTGLGIWDFAWSITSYLTLSQLGIGAALNRYVARYRTAGDTQALVVAVSTTVGIQFAIAALVSAACFALYWGIPYFFADELGESTNVAKWVALLLGLSVAVNLVFDTSRGILTGCHRWDVFNAVNSTAHLTSTAAMIGVLLLGHGLVEMAAVYLFFSILQGLARFYAARRICPEAKFQRKAVSATFGREIFSYGIRSVTVNISPVIVQQSFFIAVVSSIGPAALAILARPLALTNYIATFITRFTFVLTPMVESVQALEGEARLKDFTKEAARYELAFVLPPAILFALFGTHIIDLWMGPDYINKTLVWLFALSTVMTMSQSSLLRTIIGLDRHAQAAKISLAVTLLLVATFLTAGYVWQIQSVEYFGAAIAVSNVVVYGIYIPIYSCAALDIKLSDYLRSIAPPPIIFALVAGGLLLGIDHVMALDLTSKLILAAAYSTAVSIAYYAWLVPDQFKRQIHERLGWL